MILLNYNFYPTPLNDFCLKNTVLYTHKLTKNTIFRQLDFKKNFNENNNVPTPLSNLFYTIYNYNIMYKKAPDHYINLVELESDNDFYDLFYLKYWFQFKYYFFLKKNNNIYIKTPINICIHILMSKYILIHIVEKLEIFKKNKAIYIRPFLLKKQFLAIVKRLKKIKFKKKRKSALIFFQKKKYYSFIKLKRRFFKLFLKKLKKKKFKKFKRWKSKLKSKVYKPLMYSLKKKLRKNLFFLIFLSTKKKRFFFKKNSNQDQSLLLNKKLNYNLNLIPFYSFSKEKQFFILKNLNIFQNKLFSKLFVFFTSNFFEKLTNQKTFVKLFTNLKPSSFENFWINYFVKKYFFFQKQFKGVLHLNEFVYILLLTFKYKDLFFLKNWISNFLEKINLKKHKAFIRGFKRIVLSILNTSAKLLNIKGFLFDIRGKVGVSGNAKKRHTSIRYKCYGFTKISLKADQIKFLIRTNTGVLGATLILTY